MSSPATSYRNRYFITRNKTEFYELTPLITDDQISGSRYFIRAFRYLESHSAIAGKTFVVVELGTEALPAYGPDVIVIVVSDSFQKIPAFAGRVGLIFKCLGLTPKVNLRPSFSYLYGLMLLRYVRSMVDHRRSLGQARRSATGPLAPMYPIPLGDRDLTDLDVVPIKRRTHDVSFLGSVATNARSRLTVTGVLGTPKISSRRRMFEVLKSYKESRGTSTITLTTTSFSGGSTDSTRRFSELLNDTKVCVVPRGDVPETYRYFQGMRYGCVVIAEQLPDDWFFKGSPAHTIRTWDELPGLLDRILGDDTILETESQASLRWWNEVVSYEALGRYLTTQIERHFASGGRGRS